MPFLGHTVNTTHDTERGQTDLSDGEAGQIQANRSGAPLSELKETLRVAKIATPSTVPVERGATVSAHTAIST